MLDYIICIVAVIIALILLKKLVGCLARIAITLILIAVLVALYLYSPTLKWFVYGIIN